MSKLKLTELVCAIFMFITDNSEKEYCGEQKKNEVEHDISKHATKSDLVTSTSVTFGEEVKELCTELAALTKLLAEMD